ncbi:MAG TPA: response regulator [Bacteroidia bacterium]|nr:response regulator [Bacteroidia bacterium]HNP99884.1 response regulator [Bacteroidia bacterium]
MENSRIALIIDDEQDICYLLGKMLASRSLQTHTASSITEGLHKLEKYNPYLLFLDIHLPDGSGLEHIKKIRSSHPKTIIVVMSAYDSHSERSHAKEHGADFFLPKPFQREMVDELINTSFLKA